jgi:peptidoglycan/LPS O-acetylase OafA/YrhL
MRQGFSVWLDALRILAALTVVASHVAYPRFTYGTYQWMRDLNLGSDAVILFFVVSGLVIAKAAARDGTLARYAFNRATRLYSVMIPALLLTWTLDRIGLSINSLSYPAQFYQHLPLPTFLLSGLTFSNEWFVVDPVRLGSNGPLWSLSYEVAYYALFGAFVFLSGVRRILVIVLLSVIVGPLALLLMPSWIFGVLLWKSISGTPDRRMPPMLAWILAILPPVLYAAALALSVPGALSDLTAAVWPAPSAAYALRFSSEFVWNGLIGLLVAAHLLGMAHLLTTWHRGVTTIRWLAGASFSVYVTHYPALHFLDAITPPDLWARGLWLLVASISVGLIFAQLFERPLERWRRLLWPRRPLQA